MRDVRRAPAALSNGGSRGGSIGLDRLGGSHRLIVLALLVGLGAGVGAIGFRELIVGVTQLFSGHADYSAAATRVNPRVPWLGRWFVVLAPVVGGLLYGPLVSRFAPEARGHGVPEVMYAVSERGGRIRPQVPAVKALASALCIGSGGSVGREGPIVQIGSALGSVAGQLARVSEQHLQLLVACGAAGGIAATFNAPIAGVFFALEVILRNFETRSFALVVVSSVVAAAVGRLAFGSQAFLTLPTFHVVSAVEYPLYVLLGVLCVIAGLLFVRVLYASEDLADRVWRGPQWARPAVGGVLLGLLLLAVPQMYGVGYPVLQRAVGGHYLVTFLILLLIGKILATSLTIAIGGSGGVFAPSLFIGAMLGSAYGQAIHAVLPGLVAPPGAYGLVAMGAVFAAAARAPMTAVLIIFELTGDYSIILPLMLAVVVAAALANHFTLDTIYTLKLRRRGIDIDRHARGPMSIITVAQAMHAPPDTLSADTPASVAARRLGAEPGLTVPVTNERGELVGVISARELEPALAQADDPTVGTLAYLPTVARSHHTLEDAIRSLAESGQDALLVLSDEHQHIIGWLDHRAILLAYPDRAKHERRTAARELVKDPTTLGT